MVARPQMAQPQPCSIQIHSISVEQVDARCQQVQGKADLCVYCLISTGSHTLTCRAVQLTEPTCVQCLPAGLELSQMQNQILAAALHLPAAEPALMPLSALCPLGT